MGRHPCLALWHLPKAHDPARAEEIKTMCTVPKGQCHGSPGPEPSLLLCPWLPPPTSAFAASVPWVTSLSYQPLSEEDEHEGTDGDVETAQTTWPNSDLEGVLAYTGNMHQFAYDKNLPTCAKQSKMPTSESSDWLDSVGSTRDLTPLFLSTAGGDSQALKGSHGHVWGQKASTFWASSLKWGESYMLCGEKHLRARIWKCFGT